MTLKLDKDRNTFVIIGNNGAGKSNLLEALSSVFNTLYYDPGLKFEFSFHLSYEIRNHKVAITNKMDRNTFTFKVDNAIQQHISGEYLPSKIVCNYSGEDRRLWDSYYRDPFNRYISAVRSRGGNADLNMIYVDRDDWKLILLVMLCFADDNVDFKRFFEQTLHLEYQDSSILFDEKTLGKWSDENIITNYVKQLKNTLSEKGEVNDIKNINITGQYPLDVFYYLLGANPLIRSITIHFKNDIDSTLLSEGEKKYMVILFILEVLADENTLVLMDEPDSHIHVSRKAELKALFDRYANRDNIITSHSPTLTAKFDKESILMLDKADNGNAVVIDKRKSDIVYQLTNGIWSLQDQNIFLASHKDILLVEGKTDISYIKNALEAFHQHGKYTQLEIECLPCGGASGVKQFTDNFKSKPGQIVIAFFDCDRAGQKAIREIFKDAGGAGYTVENFGKARQLDGNWFSFYPQRNDIVNFNVEDYFPRLYLMKKLMSAKSLDTIPSKDTYKSDMARLCDNGQMPFDDYRFFRILFDRIAEIKDAENNHLERI